MKKIISVDEYLERHKIKTNPNIDSNKRKSVIEASISKKAKSIEPIAGYSGNSYYFPEFESQNLNENSFKSNKIPDLVDGEAHERNSRCVDIRGINFLKY